MHQDRWLWSGQLHPGLARLGQSLASVLPDLLWSQFGLDLRAHCEADVIDRQASFLAFKYSGKEELLAENVSSLTISKRVSWDPEIFMIRSERGNYSLPVKTEVLALALPSVFN